MKLTTLLMIFALVIVACSPNADTTVQQESNGNNEEVIENTENEAQTVDTSDDETADSSSDEMASDEMDDSDDMASDEMADMDESEEHSDEMADDSDMTDSDSGDEMMDESADHSDDMSSDDDDSMMEESEDMADTDSDDTMMDSDTDTEEMADNTEADTSMTVAYNAPDWANLPLVNARTGETFSLADFAGKSVFIEPMATWCTNCRNQQRRINEVVDQLSPDEYVIMSLSVETYLSAGELAEYAERNEFGWTFAVATEDLVNALVTEFGRSVSNPPSVPHFTISPDGSSINFTTGGKSGEEFLTLVRSIADGS